MVELAVIENLKSAYRATLSHDPETPKVVEFVNDLVKEDSGRVVVDVGCGYGRTLRALKNRGIDAIGVETNSSIAERNRREGLRCMSPDEFLGGTSQADVMIMSHVIEHFAPEKLLEFMDRHLDRLRPGGHLIIATPLLHPRFFDDFDHAKPYHPTGLTMVFGEGKAQVQYFGRNRLVMTDLWFRRSLLTVNFARGLYIRNWTTRVWQVVNLLGMVLFRVSGGIIGRPTGWVGVFRKEALAAP